MNIDKFKVGQKYNVKMGVGHRATTAEATVIEWRQGTVKRYLIDSPNQNCAGGLLGVAIEDETGELNCTCALPYKNVGGMDALAAQLGF